MISLPFLTKLDSRAAIKGSRDPLGIQPLWTRLGRDIVGNLTTVSNSVTDFSVLLLGFHFVETVAATRGSEYDLATFLKWEQLAAYARANNDDYGFRGTDRVRRRVGEKKPWPLSIDSDAQILSDQKNYGLWGLYTVPAKSSGLIDSEPPRLTSEARDVVQAEFLRQIDQTSPRSIKHITSCVSSDRYVLNRKKVADAQMLDAVGKAVAMPGARTRELFHEHLLNGGKSAHDTRGRQRVLSELLTDTLTVKDWRISPQSLLELAQRAGKKHGEVGQSLEARLKRIYAAESVLAPGAALFQHLLGCDGQDPDNIASNLHKHWGAVFQTTIPRAEVEAWTSEMRSWKGGLPDAPTRWLQLSDTLHSARYRDAIELVLKQNADVMQSRSVAAPWIVVASNRRLSVRFKDESAARLPTRDEIPGLWRHPYFIQSLRDVAGYLEVRR